MGYKVNTVWGLWVIWLLSEASHCGFRSVVSACSVITPIFHIKQSLSPSFSLSECHSSCSGCTGGSFQNCTSCVRPRILQQEQCLDKCSHGFYVQDRSCQGGYGCYSVPSHKRNLFPCGLICSMDYFLLRVWLGSLGSFSLTKAENNAFSKIAWYFVKIHQVIWNISIEWFLMHHVIDAVHLAAFNTTLFYVAFKKYELCKSSLIIPSTSS